MTKKKLPTFGFGVPASTDPHHYQVVIPAGNDNIEIVEHLGMHEHKQSDEKILRVTLNRSVWTTIKTAVQREFNARLKQHDMKVSSFKPGANQVERLLGKELCMLAWAVQDASKEQAQIAVRNWVGMKPEERWWLFGMAESATADGKKPGRADTPRVGWRLALFNALCDGEAPMPKKRQALPRKKEDVQVLLF
jgi:hypothetical protein